MPHTLLQHSYGQRPQVVQDDVYPEGISQMCLSSEQRTLVIGTSSGQLVLIDAAGRLLYRENRFDNLTHLAWAEAGNFGVAVIGAKDLVCFDQTLTQRWKVSMPVDIVGVAISPHGSHIAVSTGSSMMHIVTVDKSEVAKFETTRPVEFIQFSQQEAKLIAAAEFGHLCCHLLDGTEQWNERIMNNVGNMVVSADGKRILLSAFNHGVQVLGGTGKQKGAFVVDGIPDLVLTSPNRRRLAVRTIEHRIYWLDFEGNVKWGCDFGQDPVRNICPGPLGDRLFISTDSGRLMQLEW